MLGATGAMLVLASLASFASTANAQRVWEQTAAPLTGPTRGLWPGLAYALSTGKCYLYGGSDATTTGNETWEYDGATATWSMLNTVGDPGERHTFGICYDAARDRVVMFGGANQGYTPSGETWEFDPATSTWTNVTPTSGTSPIARYGCHMAYDIVRGVSVLYGGWSGSGFTNDTWEWDGTTWTQITTVNLPTGRDRFGFCYDLQNTRCLLFGGITGAGESDETWTYDGTDWTLLNPVVRPPARQKTRLAYDAQRGVAVLQGGQAAGQQRNDSWEFDGSNWRIVPSTPTPARGENGFAFDIGRGVAVTFGGYGTNGTNTDTWEYRRPTTPVFTRFGTGCAGAGGVPLLVAATGSSPTIGTTFDMALGNLTSTGGFGYLLLGLSNSQFSGLALPIDAGILGWTGCTGYVSPDAGFGFSFATSPATVSLPLPNNPALAQATIFTQAILFDGSSPNGQVAMSNAGEMILN